MVYQIVWTPKALESYLNNIEYLEQNWTSKEVTKFVNRVEKKILLLSVQPYIGASRSKKRPNLKFTLLHKRIILIYLVKPNLKRVELLLFWNTYQNPAKLRL